MRSLDAKLFDLPLNDRKSSVRVYNPCIGSDGRGGYVLSARATTQHKCGSTAAWLWRAITKRKVMSSLVIGQVGPRFYKQAKIAVTELAPVTNILGCPMWFGFEDPRIVNLGGVVYLLASFRNKDCISQMCLFVLEGTHVKRQIEIASPSPKTHEKNWMPFKAVGKRLLAVYKSAPHTIVEIDTVTGGSKIAFQTPNKTAQLDGARGSCSPIPVGSQFLAMVHRRGKGAAFHEYTHQFYTFEKKAPYRVTSTSDSWVFNHTGKMHIEFACGMIVIGKDLVITYGEDDCYSRAAVLPLTKVMASLTPC